MRKKSNDMCLQNYQHSLTLYERMCTGDVQKCKITTFEYWLIIQHYDKQNFAKRTCMLNLIHYRYTYLVMSSCLFSFVIFKGCFWMKYLVFRSFGIYKHGLFLAKLGYSLPFRFFPDKFGKMQYTVVVNKCMW